MTITWPAASFPESSCLTAFAICPWLLADEDMGGKVAEAYAAGLALAEKATEKGVTDVVFDRAGYPYHGRVKALAEAAREVGLQF